MFLELLGESAEGAPRRRKKRKKAQEAASAEIATLPSLRAAPEAQGEPEKPSSEPAKTEGEGS